MPHRRRVPTRTSQVPPQRMPPPPGQPMLIVAFGEPGVAPLLQCLPELCGAGRFVIILVHSLAAEAEAALLPQLEAISPRPVVRASTPQTLQASVVYLLPGQQAMLLDTDQLRPAAAPSAPTSPCYAIENFLRSVARTHHERATALILPGMGGDCVRGLQLLKEAGGLVVALTSPATDASLDPAVGEQIDLMLTPAELFDSLAALCAPHPEPLQAVRSDQGVDLADQLPELLSLLREHTSHDFSGYKESTLGRRIERRMVVNHVLNIHDYIQLLRNTPLEIDALFREFLIGVTSFFRDADAFDRLQQKVILPLFAQQRESIRQIRVWIPGCSTGEEAYSIAILLSEQLERSRQPLELQVFATDIDDAAIRIAREGVYANNIVWDLSPERLRNYFTYDKKNATYRVTSALRDMVVFASHNVIKDPPFSRIDLISCRNLMIYFNSGLQQRLLQLLHFALNPRGFLFLGTSETLGHTQRLFYTLDQGAKIFQRLQRAPALRPSSLFPASPSVRREPSPTGPPGERALSLRELTEQILLSEHLPTSIVVNEKGDMLYVHGRTGRYVEHFTGEASTNLLKVARDELRASLASLLRDVAASRAAQLSEPIWLAEDGDAGSYVRLALSPISRPEAPSGLSLLVIHELPAVVAPKPPSAPDDSGDTDHRDRAQQLERELRSTREYLRSTVEELEHANDQLRTTNDQLQSSNEELQSTNEELQTSKEELQSVNEELAAVNAELQAKVVELLDINNDIKNLFDNSEVGIIFLDLNLRIRRFTPMARLIVDMIPEDIGRPFGQFTHTLQYEGLLSDIRTVASQRVVLEREAESADGNWYLIRIIPYRTLANIADGIVITFTNITQVKKADQARRESEIKFQKVFDNSPLMKSILDVKTDIFVDLNQHFLKVGGYTKAELLGKSPVELGWTPQAQRDQLMQTLTATGSISGAEQQFTCKDGTTIPVLFSAFFIEVGGRLQLVQVAQDIRAWRQAEQARRLSEERLQTIVDFAPIGLAVLDDQRRLLAMNARASEVFDVTVEGVTSGRYAARRYLRADGSPMPETEYASVRALTEGRAVGDVEVGVIKEDGSQIWSLTHAAPLPGGGIVVAVQDIGERKRAEQELKIYAGRFERLFNKAPFAIGLLRLSDYTIIDVNDAFVRLFGYSKEESIGKTTTQLGLRPNQQIRAQLLQKISQGEEVLGYEMDLYTQSGNVRSMLISLSSMSINGERFYIATAEDITLRKQAEEALRASEAKYQDLFDHAPDMYLTIDSETDLIVDCNQTAVSQLGFDKAELLERRVADLFDGEHALAWRQRLQAEFLRTGRLQNERARLVGKDGRVRDVSISVTASRDESGKVRSGRMVVRDVTERLRAEDALRAQLTQEKETVLRELAHRTKNNMLVIRSMLSLQAMRSQSEEVQRLVVDVDSKILAMALVHQKLYESRNLSRIDLGDYLRELASALASGFSLVPGQVTITIHAEPMVTLIDTAVPCGLAVTELVSNAFKHAFPHGRTGEIVIELDRCSAERVRLRIRNDGVSPPAGFDFRKGSALGLRTVFMIVEHQLKGTVQFAAPESGGILCEIEFPNTQYSERV